MPNCVIEIVIDFSERTTFVLKKNLIEIDKKINHRTNTAIFYVTGSTVQKIGRAAQADFFREVGGAYEYLCRARAVHDVTRNTRQSPAIARQAQRMHYAGQRRHPS